MIEVQATPAISTQVDNQAFTQTLRLMDGETEIARATWHCPASASAGIIQIIELHVNEPFRRRGMGKRIMQDVYKAATAYLKLRKAKFRRAWMAIEQKTQVVGRAFLTSRGYHHVSVINDLFVDQDLMIYIKSLD